MSEGAEGAAAESQSGGFGGGQEGYSQGQQGGYERSAEQPSSYQDMEARQGIAALYNAIQGLTEKMKGVDTLQERLSPLWQEQKQQEPAIDDYDGTILTLQRQVEALAKLFETDQEYRKDSYQKMQQQKMAQYQQELQSWVSQTTQTIDTHLEDCGYPGFAMNAHLVRNFLEKEYTDFMGRVRPNSKEAQVATQLVNNPQFWADVYVQEIIPALSEQSQRFNMMAERRTQSRYVPEAEKVYSGRHVWR